MPSLRCFFSRIFLAGLLLPGLMAQGVAPHSAVDQTPALVIGSYRVSHYVLGKYYGRFVEAVQAARNRPPTPEERRSWLDDFVAQQIVTAHAATLGYLDRPEVQATVARMERHMLIQPEGPLHREPAFRTDEELREMFPATRRTIDGWVVRFDDDATADRVLGRDFSSQSAAEQTQRIRLSLSETAESFDGRLTWPYAPFSEIASVLTRTEPRKWIRQAEPGFGTYLLLVRAGETREPGPFEAALPDFKKAVWHIDRQIAFKRHRIQRLREAGFSLRNDAGQRVAAAWLELPPQTAALPELPAALQQIVLFTYHAGGVEVAVTAETFRRRFNDRIIRRVPRSAAELKSALEDDAVAELDVTQARAEGLDETPQFTEDRRGFAGLQALDLYEREVLAPKIVITPEAITRTQQAHPADSGRTPATREAIRFRLLREALDQRRRELARELREKYPVEDHIDRSGPAAPLPLQTLSRGPAVPGFVAVRNMQSNPQPKKTKS